MPRERSPEEAADWIGEFVDEAADLTARFLAVRAELSASAGFAMNSMRREGPLRITTLAAKEGISQPSMTQLTQRLERQGLVIRLTDPDDGRAALVDITALGQATLDERTRSRRGRLSEMLATLTPEEKRALWLAACVASPLLQRVMATTGCTRNDRGVVGQSRDGRAPKPDEDQS